MKANIHPKYYPQATITCACGNVFKVGSTVEKIEVEICSACHPFYTGKQKLVDSAGQVDRFRRRLEMAQKLQKSSAKKSAKKSSKVSGKKTTSKESAQKSVSEK